MPIDRGDLWVMRTVIAWLVHCFYNGEDFVNLTEHLEHEAARSAIRVWMNEGRVEVKPRGGARNVKMDDKIAEQVQPVYNASSDPGSTAGESTGLAENRHIPSAPTHNQLISLKIARKDAESWQRNWKSDKTMPNGRRINHPLTCHPEHLGICPLVSNQTLNLITLVSSFTW